MISAPHTSSNCRRSGETLDGRTTGGGVAGGVFPRVGLDGRRRERRAPVALGLLDHRQSDAVFDGTAGILTLELDEDAGVGVRTERGDVDQGRIADEVEPRAVESHLGRDRDESTAPPATAGRIDTSSESVTGVSSADIYRTSSSFTYTFTNLWSVPSPLMT